MKVRVHIISELLHRLALFDSHLPLGLWIADFVTLSDRKGLSSELYQAIADETVGLLNEKALKVVIRQELGEEAHVLGGRFIIVIKNNGTYKNCSRQTTLCRGTCIWKGIFKYTCPQRSANKSFVS